MVPLDAMYIHRISDLVDNNVLGLLRNVFASNSRARLFYSYQMQLLYNGHNGTSLVHRASDICANREIHFVKYIFNDKYAAMCKNNFKHKSFSKHGSDGFVDTVPILLGNFCDINKMNKEYAQILLVCIKLCILQVSFNMYNNRSHYFIIIYSSLYGGQ